MGYLVALLIILFVPVASAESSSVYCPDHVTCKGQDFSSCVPASGIALSPAGMSCISPSPQGGCGGAGRYAFSQADWVQGVGSPCRYIGEPMSGHTTSLTYTTQAKYQSPANLRLKKSWGMIMEGNWTCLSKASQARDCPWQAIQLPE